MKSKLAVFIAALLLAALVAGCGDDKKSDSNTDDGAQVTESTGATGSEESASTDEFEFKAPKVSGPLKKRPVVEPPSTPPPEELFIKDIIKGTGKKATGGDEVSVQYVGIAWSTGVEFDASWNSGKPFEFILGANKVIKGWDQGVKGMRIGGRRLLVVPPDLAYGEAGQGASIGPNETLVFVVDLKKVK